MDRFTQKVGPLPAWAWGLILAVGSYLGYRYIQSRQGAAVTQAAQAAALGGSTDPASLGGSSTGADTTVGDSGSFAATPTIADTSDEGAVDGTTVAVPGTFTSNAEWGAYAAMHLAASGADPITASNALTDYLAGNPLSVSEAALVSAALVAYGVPPQGLIPVTLALTSSAAASTSTAADTTTAATGTVATPAPSGIQAYLSSLAPVASVGTATAGSQAITPDGMVLYGDEINEYNSGGINAVTSSPVVKPVVKPVAAPAAVKAVAKPVTTPVKAVVAAVKTLIIPPKVVAPSNTALGAYQAQLAKAEAAAKAKR